MNNHEEDPRRREIADIAGRIAALAEKFAREDAGLAACLKFASRSLALLAEGKPPENAAAGEKTEPAVPSRSRDPFEGHDPFGDDMIRPIPAQKTGAGPEITELSPRPEGSPYLRFSHDHAKTRAEIREHFREANRIFSDRGTPKPALPEENQTGNDIIGKIERLAREFRAGGGDLAGRTRMLPGMGVWESCDSLYDIAARFFSGSPGNSGRSPVFRFKRILKKYGSSPEEWGSFAVLPAALSGSEKSKLLLVTPCRTQPIPGENEE